MGTTGTTRTIGIVHLQQISNCLPLINQNNITHIAG
jgi:hypothetical protein